MPALKVFEVGNLGGINGNVRDALGEAPWIRQGRILIVAPNKTVAHDLAAPLEGISVPRASHPEFRVAMGNDVDALQVAGLLGAPRVFVLSMSGGQSPVVQVDPDGPRVIGRLVRDGLSERFEEA